MKPGVNVKVCVKIQVSTVSVFSGKFLTTMHCIIIIISSSSSSSSSSTSSGGGGNSSGSQLYFNNSSARTHIKFKSRPLL